MRSGSVGGSSLGQMTEIGGRVPDQRLAVDKVSREAVTGVDATTYGRCSFDTFTSYRIIASQ